MVNKLLLLALIRSSLRTAFTSLCTDKESARREQNQACLLCRAVAFTRRCNFLFATAKVQHLKCPFRILPSFTEFLPFFQPETHILRRNLKIFM
jgi:hypothetical protein